MRFKYIRLSTMMFLQLFISGCTMPIFSLYMKDYLHFSGSQIGIIMAMSALPALLSPVIGAFIADRLISAERLLIICNLAGALLMMVLYKQSTFLPVLICYLLYGLITGPTFALTTTISFHHAPDAVRSFGGIRLWGTIGWFAAAWVFSFFWSGNISNLSSEDLHSALQLSAVSSLILAFYAFSLPVGLKREKGKVILIPKDSLKVILQPEILIISLFCIVLTFADRFYTFGGGPFLKSLGYNDRQIMPVLSLGQIPEILGLGILALVLNKIGLKKTLLCGAFFEVARFLMFIIGGTRFLYLGIAMHGLTYAYFFVPLVMFLDNRCDRYSRAGVHQLFSIITGGVGGFAGNLLAGYTADLTTISSINQINFTYFWSVPLILSIIGFAGIFAFLSEQKFVPVTSGNSSSDLKVQNSEV